MRNTTSFTLLVLILISVLGCGWWPSSGEIRKGFNKAEFQLLHDYTLEHLDLFQKSEMYVLGIAGTNNPQAPMEMQKYMKDIGVKYIRISKETGEVAYIFRSDWESATGVLYVPEDKTWYQDNLKDDYVEDLGDDFYYFNFL